MKNLSNQSGSGDMELMGSQVTRASHAERSAVVDHLRKAHNEGRLTGEEFHARSEFAMTCATRDEMRPLVADLPHDEHVARINRWAKDLEEAHEKHHAYFHIGAMLLCVMVAIGSTAVGQAAAGGWDALWHGAWGILPASTYVVCALGFLFAGISWVVE